MRVNEKNDKAGVKLNIKKTKIMASSPITLWQIGGEKGKQWWILFSWASKSLWVVSATMKLQTNKQTKQNTCSFEEKECRT